MYIAVMAAYVASLEVDPVTMKASSAAAAGKKLTFILQLLLGRRSAFDLGAKAEMLFATGLLIEPRKAWSGNGAVSSLARKMCFAFCCSVAMSRVLFLDLPT